MSERLEDNVGMNTFLVRLIDPGRKVKLKEEDFESAHRLGPFNENVCFPRTITFKLHHLQKKILILRAARERRQSNPNDTTNYRIIAAISTQLR